MSTRHKYPIAKAGRYVLGDVLIERLVHCGDLLVAVVSRHTFASPSNALNSVMSIPSRTTITMACNDETNDHQLKARFSNRGLADI
jgi:hypothetical protein